jgi:hypothetical protein
MSYYVKLRRIVMDDNNFPKKSHLTVKNGKLYYEVYAIVYRKYFLIEVSKGELGWCNVKQFEVEDKPIPQFWLYKKIDYGTKNYKFKDSMLKKEIWGPEEFVNNTDFLLDIDYRDNKAAYKYALKVSNKYNHLFENNIISKKETSFINSHEWFEKYLK